MFPRARMQSWGCFIFEIFPGFQKNHQKLNFSTLKDPFLGKNNVFMLYSNYVFEFGTDSLQVSANGSASKIKTTFASEIGKSTFELIISPLDLKVSWSLNFSTLKDPFFGKNYVFMWYSNYTFEFWTDSLQVSANGSASKIRVIKVPLPPDFPRPHPTIGCILGVSQD